MRACKIHVIMTERFNIDPDISKAETLPARFYRDSSIFEVLKEKVFYRTWQWIGTEDQAPEAGSVTPQTLLPEFLSEPLVLTRDKDKELHCLSNVCTHRGNLVITEAGTQRNLICGYHGRRFGLDGSFEHMPEFKETKDFPRPCDNLHAFPIRQWGPFLFAGLNPAYDFQEVIDTMKERVGFMPIGRLKYEPSRTKDYEIKAHWALYCDNYLEGFHIPFVHEGLNAVLDYGNYETVLHDHLNLQIGYAEGTEAVFDLPEGHIDHGKSVAAYYYWVFPNMMFNFYPWGVSVNIVMPKALDHTTVRFMSYVSDPSKLDTGAGNELDAVELEDEEVVEGVHLGVRSAFYKAGRFSPTREQGVHHFHRLLAQFLGA